MMKEIENYKGVRIIDEGSWYQMRTDKPIFDSTWFGRDVSLSNCRKRIDQFMRHNHIKSMADYHNGYSC